MEDFEVIDEGYTNMELQPGLNYLLQTDHPQCDKYIGWEHKVNNSRVVYLMGGHDHKPMKMNLLAGSWKMPSIGWPKRIIVELTAT